MVIIIFSAIGLIAAFYLALLFKAHVATKNILTALKIDAAHQNERGDKAQKQNIKENSDIG
jgi:hypothetical protein